MCGRIESGWAKTGTGYHYRLVVLANTTATLYLSAPQERNVIDGGMRAAKAQGVKFLCLEKDKIAYELSAGSYELETRP